MACVMDQLRAATCCPRHGSGLNISPAWPAVVRSWHPSSGPTASRPRITEHVEIGDYQKLVERWS
jgi:hypothetical protein